MIVGTASESLFDWEVPAEGVPWEEYKEKMAQQWREDQEPANDGWTDSSGDTQPARGAIIGSASDTWPLHQDWYERQRELAEASGEPAFPERMTRAWTDAQPMDGDPYGDATPPPLAAIREDGPTFEGLQGLEWQNLTMRHDDADPDEQPLRGPAQPELEAQGPATGFLANLQATQVPPAAPAAAPAPTIMQINYQAMVQTLRDREPGENPQEHLGYVG